MSEIAESLVLALRERDEARRLLASVEQLEIGGAVTEAHRDAAREDYRGRLANAEDSVRLAREAVAARGRQISAELETIRQQEAALEVRYKVGEYGQDQYQKAADDLNRKSRNLAKESDDLRKLYEADTAVAAEAASTPMQGGVPTPGRPARSTTTARPARRATSRPARQEASGGIVAWLTEGPRLRLLSVGLVVVGALVVVLLLAQVGLNAAGGFALPGLSNPFGGGGDETPLGMVPGDDLDEQSPSQNDTTTVLPAASGIVDISVNLQGAPGVGSLHAEMVFDTGVLELVGVQQGALPADALMRYAVTPGRVTIGLVSPSGITGNGSVAVVSLRTLPSSPASGQSPVLLDNVVAHHSDTLQELATSSMSGSVDFGSRNVMAPVVVFGA